MVQVEDTRLQLGGVQTVDPSLNADRSRHYIDTTGLDGGFAWKTELSLRGLQAAYWWQFDHGEALTVEYGNDVEGTAFAAPDSGDPLGKTKWNLQVCRKLHIIVNLELHPQCYLSLLMHSYKFLLKHSLVDHE